MANRNSHRHEHKNLYRENAALNASNAPAVQPTPNTRGEQEKAEPKDDYVSQAEAVIKGLKDAGFLGNDGLTTSKMRSLYSLIMDIYNDELPRSGEKSLSTGSQSKLQMARVRIIYEMGRDATKERVVCEFVERAKLTEKLERIQTRKEFMDFAHYMEALVAYHRYYSSIKDQKSMEEQKGGKA